MAGVFNFKNHTCLCPPQFCTFGYACCGFQFRITLMYPLTTFYLHKIIILLHIYYLGSRVKMRIILNLGIDYKPQVIKILIISRLKVL
jgi:hypothetical protein